MRIGRDVHGNQLLFLRVFVNHLDVVQNVATVELIVMAAHAHDGFRGRAEHPLCDIHLVRGEFCRQTARILAIQPPVGHFLVSDIRHGLHLPARVSVPLGIHVCHVPQNAFIHHGLNGLIELTVTALQAYLHDLFRPLVHQRFQFRHFMRFEDEALFAERVFSGQQRVFGDGKVHEERYRDDDGIYIIAAQQFAVVFELRGVAPDGLRGAVQVFLANV